MTITQQSAFADGGQGAPPSLPSLIDAARSRLLVGSQLLTELGLPGGDEADAWLLDTLSFALSPLGAALDRIDVPGGALGAYRELELLERRRRAMLLRAVAERVARTALATLGSATLDVLLPLAMGARDRLRDELLREGRRPVSERLKGAVEAEVKSRSVKGDAQQVLLVKGLFDEVRTGPHADVAALAALAVELEPSEASTLVEAEVALAFQDLDGARARIAELGDSVEDRVQRIRATHALLSGDSARALAILDSMPLVMDRSSSIGAIRAAAEYRLHGAATTPHARDEFCLPVEGDERRRIARFLALAHSGDGGVPQPQRGPA